MFSTENTIFNHGNKIQPETSHDLYTVQKTILKHSHERLHKNTLVAKLNQCHKCLNFCKILEDFLVLKTIHFNKSQQLTANMCDSSLQSVQKCAH